MFQQVFGREGQRTPAQRFVYERMRQAFQYDSLVFQPQVTLAVGEEGRPVPVGQSYDPIAAAKTDGLRGAYIFIRERVEAQYTNEADE